MSTDWRPFDAQENNYAAGERVRGWIREPDYDRGIREVAMDVEKSKNTMLRILSVGTDVWKFARQIKRSHWFSTRLAARLIKTDRCLSLESWIKRSTTVETMGTLF